MFTKPLKKFFWVLLLELTYSTNKCFIKTSNRHKDFLNTFTASIQKKINVVQPVEVVGGCPFLPQLPP